MTLKFTSFQLKIIAIVTMTLDHIGLFWGIDYLRNIGRIAYPIFAFLISEGSVYTKDIKKYFLRLFSFGFILEVCYQLIKYFFVDNLLLPRNIFFTLSFGLLLIIIYKSNFTYKSIYIGLIGLISILFNYDYGAYGILMILIFYIFREKKLIIPLGILVLNLFYYYIYRDITQMYSLLAIPIIFLYNGLRGKNIKYFFYLYYPIHLIIIYLIYTLIE